MERDNVIQLGANMEPGGEQYLVQVKASLRVGSRQQGEDVAGFLSSFLTSLNLDAGKLAWSVMLVVATPDRRPS